jgi:hypothetical protein
VKLFARREAIPFFEIRYAFVSTDEFAFSQTSGLYWNSVIDDIFHTCVKEYCYFRKNNPMPSQAIPESPVSEPFISTMLALIPVDNQQQQLQAEESSCAIQ